MSSAAGTADGSWTYETCKSCLIFSSIVAARLEPTVRVVQRSEMNGIVEFRKQAPLQPASLSYSTSIYA